jgi:hypothetical protein
MLEYIIKSGNLVKFFPRELEKQAKVVLGQEPTITILGDNKQYDKSRKIDCKHYESYIGVDPIDDEDLELVMSTDVKIYRSGSNPKADSRDTPPVWKARDITLADHHRRLEQLRR